MKWHQFTAGSYDPASRQSGLDYKNLFLDPVLAETTLYHEATHSILMATSDYGQATNVLFSLQNIITKIPKETYDGILGLIYNSQFIVQEGLATIMELLHLKTLTNRTQVDNHYNFNLQSAYQKAVEPLLFCLDTSRNYRDKFTAKSGWLSLETGIRRDIVKQDLLSDIDKLQEYLEDWDKNPNKRFELIVNTIRYKPWLSTKDNETILQLSGVVQYPSTTKEEAAAFLEYVFSFTNHPHHFLSSDIGDTPKDDEVIQNAMENTFVANINLDLPNKGKVIFDIDQFMALSGDFEIIFVSPQQDNEGLTKYLEQMTGLRPEVGLLAFSKTGQGYITSLTNKKAVELVNGQLSNCTLLAKDGSYDIAKDKLFWNDNFRSPDLVVYNFPGDMKSVAEKCLQTENEAKFSHIHIGASVGHPFQSLFLKIEGKNPIYIVNTFGNKRITEIIDKIKDKTRIMTTDDLRLSKRNINNLMSLWMGMPWEIDWVETMVDGKDLHYRK